MLNVFSSELRSRLPALIPASSELPTVLLNEPGCLLLLIGLQRVSLRLARIPRNLLFGAAALMVVSFGLARLAPGFGLGFARGVNVLLLLMAAWIAWRPRHAALRVTLRLTAGLLVSIAAMRILPMVAGVIWPSWGDASQWIRLWITALTALLYFLLIAVYLAEASRRLHAETRVDALTGLANRRALDEIAAREMERAGRMRRPLSLVMLDLDHFKRLNDTLGHALGDVALQRFGEALRTAMEPGACVARLGGEEFAVLLPGFSMHMAAEAAEQMRLRVREISVSRDDVTLFLSVSIGVSEVHAGERDWRRMLHRADMALYRAKREGRDRVVTCSEPQAPALTRPGNRRRDRKSFFSGASPLF